MESGKVSKQDIDCAVQLCALKTMNPKSVFDWLNLEEVQKKRQILDSIAILGLKMEGAIQRNDPEAIQSLQDRIFKLKEELPK